MNKHLTYIIVLFLCFGISIAAAQEICDQSNSFEACFSIDRNNNPDLTEDQRIKNDAKHRGGYSYRITNKINKVQHCDVFFTTIHSLYDLENNVDGCALIQSDDFPTVQETVRERIVLTPNQTKLETNRKTPKFQSLLDNSRPGFKPLYCSGSINATCNEGCPPGQVFIDGTCRPGCNFQGELIRAGESRDFERVDADSSSRTCTKRTIRRSCDARGNIHEEIVSIRTGVLSGSSCVDGCVSPAGALTVGQSRNGPNNASFPAGRVFRRNCSVTRTTFTCEANNNLSSASSLVFNGWVNTENKCARKRGCIGLHDHGDEWTETDNCRGLLWKTRNMRCDDGESRVVRTTLHRSCDSGVPSHEF